MVTRPTERTRETMSSSEAMLPSPGCRVWVIWTPIWSQPCSAGSPWSPARVALVSSWNSGWSVSTYGMLISTRYSTSSGVVTVWAKFAAVLGTPGLHTTESLAPPHSVQPRPASRSSGWLASRYSIASAHPAVGVDLAGATVEGAHAGADRGVGGGLVGLPVHPDQAEVEDHRDDDEQGGEADRHHDRHRAALVLCVRAAGRWSGASQQSLS